MLITNNFLRPISNTLKSYSYKLSLKIQCSSGGTRVVYKKINTKTKFKHRTVAEMHNGHDYSGHNLCSICSICQVHQLPMVTPKIVVSTSTPLALACHLVLHIMSLTPGVECLTLGPMQGCQDSSPSLGVEAKNRGLGMSGLSLDVPGLGLVTFGLVTCDLFNNPTDSQQQPRYEE